MNHDAYKEQLSAFLDGELTDTEREDVLAHLETCEACQTCLAELTALHDALGDMENVEVPESFAEGVIARLHEEELPQKAKKRSSWRGIATLAACAAVVVLAVSAMPRMGGAAPRNASSSPSVQYSIMSTTTTADSAPAETEAAIDEAAIPEAYDVAAESMLAAPESAPASAEAPAAPLMATGAGASDAGGASEAGERNEAAEEDALPVLTLVGDGAADWLAEHAEPLGDGLWLVTVEETNALPDTLALVGLQEPVDGTLIITFGTTENP